MNKTEKRQFARRFSTEDWGRLCADEQFLTAINTESQDHCEIVAINTMNSWHMNIDLSDPSNPSDPSDTPNPKP